MFINIDKSKRKKEYKIHLAKPNNQKIANLSEAYDSVYSLKLGNINELSFNIPYFIDKEDHRVENENIELMKQKMYLEIDYNNSQEWMIVDEMEDFGDGKEKYLSVTAFSNVYENSHKMIRSLELKSVNPDEYYSAILQDTAWSIGEIDPLFKDIYRSFDINNSTVLESILTGAETYGAILDFDSKNKTINLLDMESRAKYRGLNINYKNFLQSVSRKSSADEMTTRMYVYGSDGMTITNVNPTGMPYIEDFSHFLYPFERDENKNVIKSSNYMSDELAHAILDLAELNEQYQPTIKQAQDRIDIEIVDLIENETILSNLSFDLSTVKGLLDIAKATNDKDLISQRKAELVVAQSAVDSQEQEVENIRASIEYHEGEISRLQKLISVTSFSPKLLKELNPFIIEKDFSDDRYINEKELYQDALENFEEARNPTYVVNASIDNIINSLEEEYYSDKVVLGDIARIVDKDMRVDMKSLITEMTFSMDENSHNITISEGDIDVDGYDRILSILYNTQSTTTMLSNNKDKWDAVTEIKSEVDMMRDASIDATKNRIYAGINESIEIGDRGIVLSNPDFPNEMVIMQAGVIALSKDGGETWDTSITPDGVIADTIIGKLVASNNLLITNDKGSFRVDSEGLTVDMDSIKIMSGEGDTPQNIVDSWNAILVTMDEFANDSLLNPYEKSQIKKQWESIQKSHSSMVEIFIEGMGPETEDNPYPLEYKSYMVAYEKLNDYLNKETQSDGHVILDPSNMDNTTDIDSVKYKNIIDDYQLEKEKFQTIIPLEFSQTYIQQLKDSISLNYVKNGEVISSLELYEDGTRINGKFLDITAQTNFNDDVVMNAGVIRSKDNAISIDLNSGLINLSRPLTINYKPVATKEDLKNIELTPGPEGKTAYNIAVDNGFVGTESQWIQSLIGTKGKDGKGIASTTVEYAQTTSGSTTPTAWSGTRPTPKQGEYMWTRTVIRYTDGTSSTTYNTSYSATDGQKGDKGDPGDKGVQGPPGPQGQSQYTHIRYSANANGNPMATKPDSNTKYIGIAITNTPGAPGYTGFTWSKYAGDDGARGPQGVPGTKGADGTTTYTWIKYADDDKGTNMEDYPEGKKYIGMAFNKTTQTESTNASHYEWSLMPQNIEIGGRNLVLNSNEGWTSTGYNIFSYSFSKPPTPGEYYTVSLKGELTVPQQTGFYLNVTDGKNGHPQLLTFSGSDKNSEGVYVKSAKMPHMPEDITRGIVYAYPLGLYEEASVEWIKIERGNTATDWTEAPEDTDAKIDEKANTEDMNDLSGQLNGKIDTEIAGLATAEEVTRNRAEYQAGLKAEKLKTDATEQRLSDLLSLSDKDSAIVQLLGNHTRVTEFVDTSIIESDAGIFVGKGVSDAKEDTGILIEPEKISLISKGKVIAYITGERMIIDSGVFMESIHVGGHRQRTLTNSDKSVFEWVGRAEIN